MNQENLIILVDNKSSVVVDAETAKVWFEGTLEEVYAWCLMMLSDEMVKYLFDSTEYLQDAFGEA